MAVVTERFLLDVTAIVGEGGTLDPARYAVDGLTPLVVARPADRDQVSALLALAQAAGARVIPWGGGTTIDRGLPPRGLDLVLVLDRLDKVIEHEPADLTVTVEAGITLAALQRALGERGQNLGLDAPLADRATIGGILASNVSGSRRVAFGTARDLTIGMRVAQPDGTITRSGGKVVKNVAGFDLNKLYIGSVGTLAIIVEATFKVAPLPRAAATLILPLPDPAAISALAARLRSADLSLRALDALISGDGMALPDPIPAGTRAVLAVQIADTPASVDRQVFESRRLVEGVVPAGTAREPRGPEDQARFWQAVQDLGRDDPAADLIARVGVRPADLGRALEAIRAAFDGRLPAAVARAGSGVITCFWSSREDPDPSGRAARLRGAAGALSGTVVIERCPTALKAAIDVWGPAGPDWRLMRAIKDQFDPAGILSPGRFVGGI